MEGFLRWLSSAFYNIVATFNNLVAFDIGGVKVGYFDLVIGFVVLGLIISVFWRGSHH